MKKSKGQTIDLLYVNKKDSYKKTKNRSKDKTNTKKRKTNTKQNNNTEKINLNNEIIIGLTPKKEDIKKKEKSYNQKKSKKKKSNKQNNRSQQRNNKTKNKRVDNTNNKSKKINLKIVKWSIIIMLLIAAVILFLMSSMFNIKQIIVTNNSKVDAKEIIDLSKLVSGVNMFKITNKSIRDNIKSNAYVENVKIKRNINGTITLDIKERIPTFMLKNENNYVYINNQGYMLEITEKPLKVPVITGFSTSNEQIKVGERLVIEDLNKLNDVIKIIESSKNSPLEDIITEIDISNTMNYILKIASQGKTIEFGDSTHANVKMQMARYCNK